MNRTVIFMVGCGVLLFGVPASRAAVESQDYVLEQPSFTYGYGTSNSVDYQLEGSVGPGGESEGDLLLRAGEPGSAVLPTPQIPTIRVVDATSAVVKVDYGDNDPHVLIQLEVRPAGSTQALYYGLSGQPVAETDSWGAASRWQSGVTLRGLKAEIAYTVRARAKSNDAAVSDFTAGVSFSLSSAPTGGSAGLLDGGPGTNILPAALAQQVEQWLVSPTGQAVAGVAEKVLVPLMVVGGVAQVAAASSVIGPLLTDFLARLLLGITSSNGLLTFFRRRRDIGTVIDGESRQPIQGARVSLLRPDTKVVVESQVTDEAGRYLFTVEPLQIYILRVEVEQHDFWERKVKGAAVNQSVVLGVSLEYNPRALRRYQRTDKIVGALVAWRVPLLLLGTASWLLLFLRDGGYTIWLGFYYVAAWLLELYVRLQPQPYGIVKDVVTEQPLPTAVVRVFSATGRLVSTLVTGKGGRFATLLRPGRYQLRAAKAGYRPSDSIEVHFTRRGSTRALSIALAPQSVVPAESTPNLTSAS